MRFDAGAARVEVDLRDDEGARARAGGRLPAGRGEAPAGRRRTVERLSTSQSRPLVCVFLPDRLELVKGPPALRRAHLDQVVAALWPARAATRRAYGQALAQRNALLARDPRRPRARASSLPAWDAELARHGIALRDDRAAASTCSRRASPRSPRRSGLGGGGELRYRPRSRAADAGGARRRARRALDSDLERGFTGHGPHRDDLGLLRDGRELRAYGSQGEQRLALLALLLAEREALAATRGAAAAHAARRRHERARRRPPRAARRAARAASGPERHHDDRPRARARAPTRRGGRRGWRSPTARSLQEAVAAA